MSDIFREVEEDLQRDRFKQLWEKYNVVAIAAAVALVVGTGGWQAWKAYKIHRNEANSERYAAAAKLAVTGKTKESIEAYAALGKEAGAGYSALARLHEAALLAKSGDQAGAAAVYDEVAADGGVDRSLRDLATLLAVEHAGEKADAASLIKRLEPLTEAGNSWRYSAIELSAVLATRMGDLARARTLYAQIADDGAAPASLRARAAEMLAALKSS